MRLNLVAVYAGIVSASVVAFVGLVLAGNWAAEAWLQRHPSILMSEADRINENTRAVREKMIPPDKATLWYDLESPNEVEPMWDEFYRAGTVFESYTHFRPRAFLGKYYGETEAGYRLSRDPGPWPPDPKNFNVFFFGGSTAFGVGPYWATVASYLEDTMNASGDFTRKVYVYNFGRSGYISTQEEVLFHRLIGAGLRPDMVVFLDGLNDFCFWDGQPSSWQALADYFEQTNAEYQRQIAGYGIVTHWEKLRDFAETMPLLRLADALLSRSRSAGVPTYTGATEPPNDKPEDEATLQRVIARYVGNMRQVKAVSAAYGIVSVFVWQPIPTYKYDVHYHLFYPDRLGCHVNSKVGYPMMAETAKERPLGDSFIWAADIQEEMKEPLYIDAFHYTAPMSRRIARFIFDQMRERNLIGD